MSFHLDLDFSNQAKKEVEYHKKAGNQALLKKLFILLNELSEHPFEGTEKPEVLKYGLLGFWSRRIISEHRIVYEVNLDIVDVVSVKGHY